MVVRRRIVPLLVGICLVPILADAQDTQSTPSFETEKAWIAKVTIGETIILGESKRGVRRVVPITGGTFEGPGIRGTVLPGGADWQLVRPDGVTELYARYLLKTHDGYLIQVINRVVSRRAPGEQPYRRSVIDLEAPRESPYSHLNDFVFLGTLDVPAERADDEEPFVIIGVYRLL
jgi:hypothetical protein